jgi:hypothetical protein
MMARRAITRAQFRTPRAAAIAGIMFSILLTVAFWLLRLTVPLDPSDTGVWLSTETSIVTFALNLVPVAGICFLWFIGVLRDRLGGEEDKFFGTVFLGSALLLLGMLFVAAAMAGGLVIAFASQPPQVLESSAFHFARAVAHSIMYVYTINVAGVFMISTSTIILYARIAPRWMAFLGYGLAALLVFGSLYVGWVFLSFPMWVMLISSYILIENLHSARRPASKWDS